MSEAMAEKVEKVKHLATSGLGLLTVTKRGGSGDGGAGSGAGGGESAPQLRTGLQLDGQMDMGDMVLGVLIACLVLGLIALLGLVIALARSGSCARMLAAFVYFVTSLPVAVALSFVTAYCFIFRTEAEALVRRYWLCLLLTEPSHKHSAAQTAWGAASAVYHSITLTASLLATCNLLLLLGLYTASRVIGWATVTANLLTVINLGQLLVGGGLVAVAAGLHSRSDGSLHADAALLVLGAGVLVVSSIGLLGSRLHSTCLLRVYSSLSTLVTAALLGFVAILYALGAKGLADSAFLSANWHYVHDLYPLSKDEFLSLLRRHWTKLMITSGLLALVQLLVVLASCVLRKALLGPRADAERATASEKRGLIAEEEEDDDDLPQVV